MRVKPNNPQDQIKKMLPTLHNADQTAKETRLRQCELVGKLAQTYTLRCRNPAESLTKGVTTTIFLSPHSTLVQVW